MISVPEEYGTADALRAVASKITCSTFVVVSGDLLTDVPVNALVASHQMHGALATVMLCPRKTSPASETKPGKPPKVSSSLNQAMHTGMRAICPPAHIYHV